MGENSLTSAVPPELGKLTDLEDLCAAPRRLRVGDGRTRRARSVCMWLRSGLGPNRFSGTLGSWVGSLAKLTWLYAPHVQTLTPARVPACAAHGRSCTRAGHAHSVGACGCMSQVAM